MSSSRNTRTPRTPNHTPAASYTTRSATPISPTPTRRSMQSSAPPDTPSTPNQNSRPSAAVPDSPSMTSAAERSGFPHPQDLVLPSRVGGSKFYVVFAGTRVGIFGNWYIANFLAFIDAYHPLGMVKRKYTLMVFPAPTKGASITGVMLDRHTPKPTSAILVPLS